jgi:2-(1,2-epoxy-1,2-dihydrophenyl)acetyl-CoA isomerase
MEKDNMSEPTILTWIEDGVLSLTLNRPAALNAWNLAMRQEMKTTVASLRDRRDVRCVLITGAGRAFSVGGDIKEMDPNRTPGAIRDRLRGFLEDVIRPLVDLETPVVAAVNGLAVGAGMSLALAADVVLAARSSYFSPAFLKVGLIPDAAAAFLLARRVGLARAKEWCLSGDRIEADDACSTGLVSRVIEDDALASEAMSVARKIAGRAPGAARLTKTLLNATTSSSLEQMIELEAAFMAIAASDPDHSEALRAFSEKRDPAFPSVVAAKET